MKQPLKKMLKAIGGGHLLKEDKMVTYYSGALGDYIYGLRPNIKGWKFDIERQTGSWEWSHSKFEDVVYATWGWEGKNVIPLESSDGLDLGTIKLKLKTSEPEDEKNLKRDAKKYIDVMKKEFPKIQKKMLDY